MLHSHKAASFKSMSNVGEKEEEDEEEKHTRKKKKTKKKKTTTTTTEPLSRTVSAGLQGKDSHRGKQLLQTVWETSANGSDTKSGERTQPALSRRRSSLLQRPSQPDLLHHEEQQQEQKHPHQHARVNHWEHRSNRRLPHEHSSRSRSTHHDHQQQHSYHHHNTEPDLLQHLYTQQSDSNTKIVSSVPSLSHDKDNHNNNNKTQNVPNVVDFLQDPVEGMTRGRRLALRLMSQAWYNPQGHKKATKSKRKHKSRHTRDRQQQQHGKKRHHGGGSKRSITRSIRGTHHDVDGDDRPIELFVDEFNDQNNYHGHSDDIDDHSSSSGSSSSSSSSSSQSSSSSSSSSSSDSSASHDDDLFAMELEMIPLRGNKNGKKASRNASGLRQRHRGKHKTTGMHPMVDVEMQQLHGKHNDKDGGIHTNGDDEHIEHRPRMVTRKERPSLAKAWAYFEHVTLPRHIDESASIKGNSADKMKRTEQERLERKKHLPHQLMFAEPGEAKRKTKLYDPIETHSSQLGDFGIGTGLYFDSLWFLGCLLLLAAFINIPNILYFSSATYSNNQPGVPFLLKGSAVCTDFDWVPCPNCTVQDLGSGRHGEAVSAYRNVFDYNNNNNGQSFLPSSSPFLVNNSTLTFALRNKCNGVTVQAGMINLVTLLLFVFGAMVMTRRQQLQEVIFDEDEQTAQDYSIHIRNPPRNAHDPQEWRDFFYHQCGGAQATAVTITLDNDLLLQTLVERRECLRRIEMLVPPGTSLDPLSLARTAVLMEKRRTPLQRFLSRSILPGVPELFAKVAGLEAKIGGLAQLDYHVKHVFCTMEHEADHRRVLQMLLASPYQARRRQNASGIKFRNKHVLLVEEPPEPSVIVWEHLSDKLWDKIRTVLTTTVCALVAVFLVATLIWFLTNHQSHIVTAIAVALSNFLFSRVAKFLTSIEPHQYDSHRQSSLFFKINAFRWVNSAIVVTIVTPFDRTIMEDGLLKSIHSIVVAEILTSNILHLADILGNIRRHVLAPRSPTQDQMNLHMKGAGIDLAERYAVSL